MATTPAILGPFRSLGSSIELHFPEAIKALVAAGAGIAVSSCHGLGRERDACARSASPTCQAALKGANAAVVGLLLAALYDPAWTCAIVSARDLALALGAFALLAYWKWPPWLDGVSSAAAGEALARWARG